MLFPMTCNQMVLMPRAVFGAAAAQTWLWTLNPSLAYVGQGIIMGTETTMHMTLGAIVGWAILSPLARHKGWAPGAVDDWENGSKGWILWISLAIMLVDAVVSLGYVSLRSLFVGGSNLSLPGFLDSIHQSSLWKFLVGSRARYALLQRPVDDDSTDDEGDVSEQQSEQDEEDAPDSPISKKGFFQLTSITEGEVLHEAPTTGAKGNRARAMSA